MEFDYDYEHLILEYEKKITRLQGMIVVLAVLCLALIGFIVFA